MKAKLVFAILVLAASVAAMLYLAPGEDPPAAQTEEQVIEALLRVQPPVPTEPEDIIDAILGRMTPEEKTGQLFLARCPEENAAADVQAYYLGGYILFGRDFDGETPDSVRSKLSAYQRQAQIPLLLAVDEEGGTVCRVSDHPAFRSTRFASPRTLYDQGGLEQVLRSEEEKASLLKSLGINVNMAPVCDLCGQPGAFLYPRSLGQSPEITGQFVSGAVRAMQSRGVGAVMKHFPGYGSNGDTHTGIVRDTRSLSELEGRDILPFLAGLEAGGGAILVSHNIVEAMDPERPASLSPAVHQYLRRTMGFEGVIVTDDLSMEAITRQYGAGEAAVLAVLAGNDLLCSTDYAVQYGAVLDAVRQGRIDGDTLDAAVRRVVTWKQSLDILAVG